MTYTIKLGSLLILLMLISVLNLSFTTYSYASLTHSEQHIKFQLHTHALLIRNLGGKYPEFNETEIWRKLNIDKASLVSILLEIAELLEEYNQSLANDLRDVAKLIYAGEIDEAYEKYTSLLPYLEKAINELYDIDPESALKILSLIKSTGYEIKYPGERSFYLSFPNLPGIDFKSVISHPLNIIFTSSSINQYLAITFTIVLLAIPIILYRGRISRYLSPVLKNKLNKLAITLKLGKKPVDPRGRIIFNYRFLLHMLSKLGFPKGDHETPREFARRLHMKIRDECWELTMLFEKAKYSHKAIDMEEADKSDYLIKRIEGSIYE